MKARLETLSPDEIERIHETTLVAVACAIFFTGFFLDHSGYVDNVFHQKDEVLLAIRLLVGIIPAVMALVAVWFMTRYPITKEMHEGITVGLK